MDQDQGVRVVAAAAGVWNLPVASITIAQGGAKADPTVTGSTGTSSYPASAVALGRMFSSEGVPRDE